MAKMMHATAQEASLMFAKTSNDALSYIRNGLSNLAATGSSAGKRMLESFVDKTQGKTFRRIEALRNKVANMWQGNVQTYLPTIGRVQQAPNSMVNNIMAMPELRRLHSKGSITAYGDRYKDYQPGTIGLEHEDYRRVTNGMLVENGDGNYVLNRFYDVGDDKTLSYLEKEAIQSTWHTIRNCLEDEFDDSDPTDEWNGVIE